MFPEQNTGSNSNPLPGTSDALVWKAIEMSVWGSHAAGHNSRCSLNIEACVAVTGWAPPDSQVHCLKGLNLYYSPFLGRCLVLWEQPQSQSGLKMEASHQGFLLCLPSGILTWLATVMGNLNSQFFLTHPGQPAPGNRWGG